VNLTGSNCERHAVVSPFSANVGVAVLYGQSLPRRPTTILRKFLDRLPIGGFTGHIFLSPAGVKLPDPEPYPDRPSEIGPTFNKHFPPLSALISSGDL
jgi:hypothetical protein